MMNRFRRRLIPLPGPSIATRLMVFPLGQQAVKLSQVTYSEADSKRCLERALKTAAGVPTHLEMY